jgi:hypothetical protein
MKSDLIGVLQRESVYISFEEPTGPMQREAAEVGFYTFSDGTKCPRVQLLTTHRPARRPLHVRDITFKSAPKHRKPTAENLTLNLSGDE